MLIRAQEGLTKPPNDAMVCKKVSFENKQPKTPSVTVANDQSIIRKDRVSVNVEVVVIVHAGRTTSEGETRSVLILKLS